MTELVAILTDHEGENVRRPDPTSPVWDLRTPGPLSRDKKSRLSKVVACRSAVWRALMGAEPAAFIRHESPVDDEVPGEWHHEGGHTWRIPADFDPDEKDTSSWLVLGGWMAYASAAPIEDNLNLLDATPERVTEWATEHGATLAIESFPDDLEWRVFVRWDA